MKNMRAQNELITESQLIEFEQHIKAKLPEDYRAFLLDCNGGYPSRCLSYLPNEKEEIVMCYFYGIGEWGDNIKRNYDSLAGEIPDGFISIGDDPGGNEYLIGLCGTEYEGQIYFWLHDQVSENEMDTSFFVANSFSEFFNGLESSDKLLPQ